MVEAIVIARVLDLPLRRVTATCGVELGPALDRSTWTRDGLPAVLTALRRARNDSIRKVATATGVTPRTLVHWERGASLPNPVKLVALERCFGLPGGTLSSLMDKPLRRSLAGGPENG